MSDRRPLVSTANIRDNSIVAICHYTIRAGRNKRQRDGLFYFKSLCVFLLFYIHAVLIFWLCVCPRRTADKLLEHSLRAEVLSDILNVCDSEAGPCVCSAQVSLKGPTPNTKRSADGPHCSSRMSHGQCQHIPCQLSCRHTAQSP